MKCFDQVKKNGKPCSAENCRFWLNYEKDSNCSIIAIQKHGAMKLHEVGDRLNLTAARIKQIETEVLKKMTKHSHLLNILE